MHPHDIPDNRSAFFSITRMYESGLEIKKIASIIQCPHDHVIGIIKAKSSGKDNRNSFVPRDFNINEVELEAGPTYDLSVMGEWPINPEVKERRSFKERLNKALYVKEITEV